MKLNGCSIKCKYMHPFSNDAMLSASDRCVDCPSQADLVTGGAHVQQRGGIDFDDLNSHVNNNDNGRFPVNGINMVWLVGASINVYSTGSNVNVSINGIAPFYPHLFTNKGTTAATTPFKEAYSSEPRKISFVENVEIQ